MRVRFIRDEAAHIEGSYRVDNFKKGQQFAGPFAQQLVDAGCAVEVLDLEPAAYSPADIERMEAAEAEGPGVDLDGDGVPEGNAHQVLDWVNEDGADRLARAQAALDAENAKDEPRKGLTADLTKLLG